MKHEHSCKILYVSNIEHYMYEFYCRKITSLVGIVTHILNYFSFLPRQVFKLIPNLNLVYVSPLLINAFFLLFCDKQYIHIVFLCLICIFTSKSTYCTCPAGPVIYNFHLSCKHMFSSFKSVCNKEHKGVT